MHRMFAVTIAGMYVVAVSFVAGTARAQEPCSLSVQVPVSLHVAPPICAGQPLSLLAEACSPCVQLLGWEQDPGGPLTIKALMRPNDCLILSLCVPDSLLIPIGTFAAGHFVMIVQVNATIVRPDSTTCSVVQSHEVSFDVPLSCSQTPLPYTDVIRVGPPAPCDSCPPPPICPDREIPFFIAGHFEDDCHEFRGLELLPSPIAGPLPQPPIARVTVAVNDCLRRLCTPTPSHWEARALMPALPRGDYSMIVELQEVSLCDSTRVIGNHTTIVPFSVAKTCSLPPAPSCFLYAWGKDPNDPACNTRVAPGTPGRLVFSVSGFAVEGLQGRFDVTPPALSLTDLRLVGPGAIGMQLMWRQLPEGASFVAFRDGPAICGAIECPWGIEMIVSPRPDIPIPAHTTVDAVDLFATDALGREVPLCPTLVPIAPANVCVGPSCDWNGDGRVDVRDLVLMVRCVRDSTSCPDSTRDGSDCNGDGAFNLDDVLCCARVILYGRMPDSVATRPAPDLRVAVGVPVTGAAGVDVPVRVSRADLVGAARLAFSYPHDRFDDTRVEVLGDASQWLQISEDVGGQMVVGLIAANPDVEVGGDIELMLHFQLAPGQSPSTDIRLASSEFAGRDGVPLAPGPPQTSVPEAQVRLALSAARPNPFGSTTRFVLSASRATEADVGVFDLTGRRLVTLHRGPLSAGDHAFTWDGTTADGSSARDGVYFYRAFASGVTATRKLVLLRGR